MLAAEVSFAERSAAGNQLRPIAMTGANTIEIVFSEHVNLDGSDGSALTLLWTSRDANGGAINSTLTASDFNFNYDTNTNTGTWSFNSSLGDGKYAILLADSVQDDNNNRLDAEWVNENNGTQTLTPDDFADDLPLNFSAMGNGAAGSSDTNEDGEGEFRFHFALLAGDYDGDGKVDELDEQLQQQQDPRADGDGDGDIDGDDLAIWQTAFANGAELPMRASGADYYDNETVDSGDWNLWVMAWLNGEYDPRIDLDGDGDMDEADFLFMQQQFNMSSAWYVGPTPGGSVNLLLGLDQIGVAPSVLDVIISGSQSLHAPFSFDTVDGSGEQLRTVPVGGADTISIRFSEPVNVAADSLTLFGLTTGGRPDLVQFTYDVDTNMATWQLSGWAIGDQYLIHLPEGITDIEGNLLDGEWTNPASLSTTNSLVSQFPSGDGVQGGDFNFVATLLPGDANLDGMVNSDDALILSANWGLLLDQLFDDSDFNGDGLIGYDDFYLLSLNWETNLQDAWVLADLNGDNIVDGADLGIIAGNAGLTGATWADGDLNGDGQVTIDDLDLAYAQWGLEVSLVA